MTVVIALDPGSKHSGICARRGDELVEHLLLVRHPDDDLRTWVKLNTKAVLDFYHRHSRSHYQPPIVACEETVDPTPHMGLTNTKGMRETAHVVGALMHIFGSRLVLVPPGGHGQGPLASFPKTLVGAREKSGHGVLSHCRSAWSVAAAAADMVKMGVV